MEYLDFIESLDEKDKNNYNHYSKIRGVQQYRIIFETLKKTNENVTYNDVNAFIMNDKAIKEKLFKYLGVLEESMKVYIIGHYDFDSIQKNEKKIYHYFNELPKLIDKDNSNGEITELYKKFGLLFSSILELLKEYHVNQYNIDDLKVVNELRNNVMHHSPLLFDYTFKSNANIVTKQIQALLRLLPAEYRKGLKKEINNTIEKTKKSVNENFWSYLIATEK